MWSTRESKVAKDLSGLKSSSKALQNVALWQRKINLCGLPRKTDQFLATPEEKKSENMPMEKLEPLGSCNRYC